MGAIALIRIIQQNEHLRLEGDETVHELREAVIHLHSHTQDKCRDNVGVPIAAVIPDVSAVTALSNRGRPRKVRNVDMTTEVI